MFDINNVFSYAFSAGDQTDLFEDVTTDSASANLIDLDKANIRIGAGKPMWIIARIGPLDWASIVSLEIRLQTDSSDDFNVTVKNFNLGRFELADMTAKALLINQPMPLMKYQRFLRIYYNVFTTNTQGGIMVALADGPEEAQTMLDHVDAGS